MERVELASWNAFKTMCVTGKNLSCQYKETATVYDLMGPDNGNLLWCYSLPKDGGADQTDFENNYKSDFNRNIGSDSVRFLVESYVTTNAFANARPIQGDLQVKRFKSKTIYVENVGANSATVKVLGNFTNDSGIENTIVLLAATGIVINTGTQITDDTPYETIQVQAKSTIVGLSTTIKTRGYALGA